MGTANEFLWGCLGSVLPMAIDWALKAVREYRRPFPGWPGGPWIVGMAVLILVGGIWNVVLTSHEPWMALYHGATAPLAFLFLAHRVGRHEGP